MKKTLVLAALPLLVATASPAQTAGDDQPMLVNIKRLSLESALAIARATLKDCRERGVQIAVTVVDRSGHPQVILRDVLAPDITLTISRQKAHTAVAFNVATSDLEGRYTSPFSVGKVDGLVMSAGGVPVQAGGTILAGVGVSGAPSGATDDACARAGIAAIADDLEMESF